MGRVWRLMSVWVVKIGGSLAQLPSLSSWLEALCVAAHHRAVAVVTGGGIFAKSFRTMEEHHALSAQQSHGLAILGTELYGAMLLRLAPTMKVVKTLPQFQKAFAQKKPALWQPYDMCSNNRHIPSAWEITSDSLAAYLAKILHAQCLIFIKARPAKQSLCLGELQKEQLLDRGVSLYHAQKARWHLLCAQEPCHQEWLSDKNEDCLYRNAPAIDKIHALPFRHD